MGGVSEAPPSAVRPFLLASMDGSGRHRRSAVRPSAVASGLGGAIGAPSPSLWVPVVVVRVHRGRGWGYSPNRFALR